MLNFHYSIQKNYSIKKPGAKRFAPGFYGSFISILMECEGIRPVLSHSEIYKCFLIIDLKIKIIG